MTSTVIAEGLRRSFGDHVVLDGVSLTAEAGSVLALLGPNGAGKTTTVRILSTLKGADGGTAQVAGFDVVRQRAEVRRRISLVGQHAALDDLQTGRENLEMVGRLLGLGRRAARRRSADLLEQFDLAGASGRRVATYSGGMRRRLDLAAGLVDRPQVLFLDEPTTGLDPRSRQALWDVLSGLTASGMTILLTTQYLEEADHLADQVAVIDGGHIVASGTVAELKSRVGGDRLVIEAIDDESFVSLTCRLGDRVSADDRSARRIEVPIGGEADGIRSLLDEIDPYRSGVAHFSQHRTSLDEVFLALTGQPSTTPTSTKETTHA